MIIGVDRGSFGAVDDKIGQQGPRPVVKGSPVFRSTDHLVGWHPGQHGTGTIPVGDPVLGIDDDGGDRISLDQLGDRDIVFRAFFLHGEPTPSVG